MASGVGEPEKPEPAIQLPPAIHIATDLDERRINGLDLPAIGARERGSDEGLLSTTLETTLNTMEAWAEEVGRV